jgi:hypothetical protein
VLEYVAAHRLCEHNDSLKRSISIVPRSISRSLFGPLWKGSRDAATMTFSGKSAARGRNVCARARRRDDDCFSPNCSADDTCMPRMQAARARRFVATKYFYRTNLAWTLFVWHENRVIYSGVRDKRYRVARR